MKDSSGKVHSKSDHAIEQDLMNKSRWVGLIMSTSFILFWLNPLNVLYRHARFDFLKIILNIVISPFGKVSFKYFFVADIITSMGTVLKDCIYQYEIFHDWDW